MLASVARIALLSLVSTCAGVLAGAMKPTGPTVLEAREARFGHCRDAGEIGVALAGGDGDHLDLLFRHPACQWRPRRRSRLSAIAASRAALSPDLAGLGARSVRQAAAGRLQGLATGWLQHQFPGGLGLRAFIGKRC